VTRVYGRAETHETLALDGLDLTVESGEAYDASHLLSHRTFCPRIAKLPSR